MNGTERKLGPTNLIIESNPVMVNILAVTHIMLDLNFDISFLITYERGSCILGKVCFMCNAVCLL